MSRGSRGTLETPELGGWRAVLERAGVVGVVTHLLEVAAVEPVAPDMAALQRAFPYTRPDRARLTWTWTIECNAIHVLRNRIAHREPIFRRDLDHDHTDMLTLAGWISAEARGWIEGLSRVPDLLAQRPTG